MVSKRLTVGTLELPSELSCQVVYGGRGAPDGLDGLGREKVWGEGWGMTKAQRKAWFQGGRGRGRRYTKPRDQPLLYFHPASGVSPSDPFLSALAKRFEVYAPVAPGFDDLDDLRQMRTVHDVVLHYDDIVQQLGLGFGQEQFVLVGHSFGAMFAAEYAAHFPSKVSALVLISAVGLWNDEFPVVDMFATPPLELAGLLWGNPESEEAKAGQAALLEMSAGAGDPGNTADPDDPVNPGTADPNDQVESTIRLVRGLVSAGKFMMPIPDRGLERRLYRIDAPTLIIWGVEDKLVSLDYAGMFYTRINDSKIRYVSFAGHMVTLEYPSLIASDIVKFVRRLE